MRAILIGTLWASVCFADPFKSLSFGGLRPATQDCLGVRGPWDPFASAGNPAWVHLDSAWALSSAAVIPELKSRASEPATVILTGAALRRNVGAHAPGFLMAVPLGDSSFVDSVDASKRSPFVTHQGRSVLLSPTYAYVSQEQNWSLGLSLPVSFQVTSVSEIYTVNDQQYARIRAGIRPNVGYEIGARKSWDETTASVSYRSSTRSKATGEISGQLPLPGLGAMNIYAHGVAAYAFTPQQVLAQMALPLAESVDWGLSLKWLDSSKTPPPFLVIDKAQPLFTVPAPNWKLRDTWQPATALSFKIADRTSLVTSYRWVPTPLKNPQVGFYDRDAHEVALGVGVGVDAFFDQVTVVGRGRFLQGGGAYAWVGLGLGGQL